MFKGARILAEWIPTKRQSYDLDSNLNRSFLDEIGDFSAQREELESKIKTAINSHFKAEKPVKFNLDAIKVIAKPPKEHPEGWNGFEVQLTIADLVNSKTRGLPKITIDIAYPEDLSDASVSTLTIGKHKVRPTGIPWSESPERNCGPF